MHYGLLSMNRVKAVPIKFLEDFNPQLVESSVGTSQKPLSAIIYTSNEPFYELY